MAARIAEHEIIFPQGDFNGAVFFVEREIFQVILELDQVTCLLLSFRIALVILDDIVLVLEPLASACLRTARKVGYPAERFLGPFFQLAGFQDEVLAAGFTHHLVEIVLNGLGERSRFFKREVYASFLVRIRQHPDCAVHDPAQEIGADQVLGIILAAIIMVIFNSLNITITNSIAKMILGGGLLRFSPTLGIILTTIIIAVGGSLISNLYPVSSALKITPLKALNHGGD